jgi:ribosomal protein S18 acetylase RimI-like enzyme
VSADVIIVPIAPEHVEGVMRLCEAEGWPSLLESSEKTWRVLTAPGVITVVAIDGRNLIGFAELQTDGEIHAHLSNIAVDATARRRGVGRRLIEDVFGRCAAKWIDLNSEAGAESFYESFGHRKFPGYRIYPDGGKRARG